MDIRIFYIITKRHLEVDDLNDPNLWHAHFIASGSNSSITRIYQKLKKFKL